MFTIVMLLLSNNPNPGPEIFGAVMDLIAFFGLFCCVHEKYEVENNGV